MQYSQLLFEKNDSIRLDSSVKRKLKLKKKAFYYEIRTEVFNGDHIQEIIFVVNYISRTYKGCRFPIYINIGHVTFYDKLVYVILESICYYLLKDKKQPLYILFSAKHTIWSEGIAFSPLKNLTPKTTEVFISKFNSDLYKRHFRKLVPIINDGRSEYLCSLMQEIFSFLTNNGIDEDSSNQLSEALIELIGNGGEHGQSECLFDLDITHHMPKEMMKILRLHIMD